MRMKKADILLFSTLGMVVLGWVFWGYTLYVNEKAKQDAYKPPTYYIMCPETGAAFMADPGSFVAKDGVFSYKVNGKQRYIMGGTCFALEDD